MNIHTNSNNVPGNFFSKTDSISRKYQKLHNWYSIEMLHTHSALHTPHSTHALEPELKTKPTNWYANIIKFVCIYITIKPFNFRIGSWMLNQKLIIYRMPNMVECVCALGYFNADQISQNINVPRKISKMVKFNMWSIYFISKCGFKRLAWQFVWCASS